jgi:hypothetical protein
MIRYFEWMGAAHYAADRRAGAMHGKVFVLDSIYSGIDGQNIYGRMDFVAGLPEGDIEIVVNLESWAEGSTRPRRALRLNVELDSGKIARLQLSDNGDAVPTNDIVAALGWNFEFRIPLALLYAAPLKSSSSEAPVANKVRLRFSIWQNRLPMDALPVQGWMELQLLPEEELVGR